MISVICSYAYNVVDIDLPLMIRSLTWTVIHLKLIHIIMLMGSLSAHDILVYILDNKPNAPEAHSHIRVKSQLIAVNQQLFDNPNRRR